jgi:hypothetical protein
MQHVAIMLMPQISSDLYSLVKLPQLSPVFTCSQSCSLSLEVLARKHNLNHQGGGDEHVRLPHSYHTGVSSELLSSNVLHHQACTAQDPASGCMFVRP